MDRFAVVVTQMKTLIMQMRNGETYHSLVVPFELDDWINECLEGLQLLDIVRVEMRDKHGRVVRWIEDGVGPLFDNDDEDDEL